MKNKVNVLLNFSITLFIFFLPVNEKISTIIIFLCLGIAFFNFRYFNIKLLTKSFIFLIALYFVYVLAYVKDNLGFGIHLFETKASLLIFPIIFSFTNINYNNLILICKAFVFGCLISYFLCLFHPLIYNFDWIEFEFLPIKPIEFLIIKNENYNWVNYFLSIDFANTIDRAYFSCFIVFALAIVLFFRKEFENKTIMVIVLFLLMALFQLNAVTGLISLSFVFICFILSLKNTKLKIALFSILMFFVIIFISYSPRLKEYTTEFKTFVKNGNNLENSFLNERLAFWKSSIRVYNVSPIFGNGIKNTQKMLNKEHQEILNWSPEWVEANNYNAHNQYLQFLIELGIIGLLIYCLSILWFLIKLNKTKNRKLRLIGLIFTGILSIHMLSESIIYRYLGIAFFSCFYCLFLAFNESNSKFKIDD